MLRIESRLVGCLARLALVFIALPAFEGLAVAAKRPANDDKSVLGVADAPWRHSYRWR